MNDDENTQSEDIVEQAPASTPSSSHQQTVIDSPIAPLNPVKRLDLVDWLHGIKNERGLRKIAVHINTAIVMLNKLSVNSDDLFVRPQMLWIVFGRIARYIDKDAISLDPFYTFKLDRLVEWYFNSYRIHLTDMFSIENISQYPTKISDDFSRQVTIGDLHANSLRLLHFLVKEGVFLLEKQAYQHYSLLYEHGCTVGKYLSVRASQSIYSKFRTLIANANLNPKAQHQQDFVIRLIGDELGDRGLNDFLILDIFKKFKHSGIELETIFSNHAYEFILMMEKSTNVAAYDVRYLLSLYKNGEINSLLALQSLVKHNICSNDEIQSLYEQHYLPYVKALSYTLHENEITIYTHAPVGLETISLIATKLSVIYDESTPEKLAKTIDNINKVFRKYLYGREVTNKLMSGDLKENPFSLLITHREFDRRTHAIRRPKILNNYFIHFVHGHDGVVNMDENIFSLNSPLGRPSFNSGSYGVAKVTGTSNLKSLKMSSGSKNLPSSSSFFSAPASAPESSSSAWEPEAIQP